jgi:hypothetical protein
MKVASFCAFYLTLFASLLSILRAIRCFDRLIEELCKIFVIVDFFVDINFMLL